MGMIFRRWLRTLLHRGTVFVAVKPAITPPPAAPQQPAAADSTLRLTAARFLH
jgi:hypothetical protein